MVFVRVVGNQGYVSRECIHWKIFEQIGIGEAYLEFFLMTMREVRYRGVFRVTDSYRDGWNVQNCSSSHVQVFREWSNVQSGNGWNVPMKCSKVQVKDSVDVIMENWLYRSSLMSKRSCCQSKKWLLQLFHSCAVKSKFLP